jgi:CubicO group peptidase (beta-lactamase class C family)
MMFFTKGLMVAALVVLLTAPAYGAQSNQFEEFFDGFMGDRTARQMPGGVCVVVLDGQVVFEKAYGYANLESMTLVSPDTVFPWASVSKLVTATAVMQLVESGKISLDTDVNEYLRSFQLKERPDGPVTVRHLLTHTGGFDERYIGTITHDREMKKPLADYLAERMPGRVHKSGELFNYSNFGISLLGLIVEEVSGEKFSDYVSNNILLPLEMTQSGFGQTSSKEADRAILYDYSWNDGWEPRLRDYFQLDPAGGFLASGADMVKFMIALLEAEILTGESIQLMFDRQFAHHPELSASGLAFRIHSEDPAIVYHDGYWKGNTSMFALIPEERLGFLVVCSFQNNYMLTGMLDAFKGTFYPSEPTALPPGTLGAGKTADVSGTFRHVRYPRSTIDKLSVLIGAVPELRVQGSSEHLTVNGQVWTSVEPGIFVSARGKKLALGRGENGEVLYIFEGLEAYEKIAWYESVRFTVPLFLALIAAFIVSVLASLITSVILRKPCQRKTFRTRLLAGGTSLVNLMFFFTLGFVLLRMDPLEFFYGIPGPVQLVLILPIVSLLLTLGVLVQTVKILQEEESGKLRKSAYAVHATACVLFLLLLWNWNLLGFWF